MLISLNEKQLQILRTTTLTMLVLLFLVVLIRTAFVCGDSYISFRTTDNLVNGYGLRWNISERVQAFTNPLWTFIISGFYYFTRDIYATVINTSIFLSLLTYYLVAFKIARTGFAAILALVALVFSKAFVDFSTSGLENPLTHF